MTPTSEKSLDRKLRRILADPSCGDYILADAKDADMAFGLAAPGLASGGQPGRGPFRSLHAYRDEIRTLVAEGLVDIMLMSASTSEALAIDERLFDTSPVTPAVRMNDTTDIWLAAGTGGYGREPALPFATTTIAQAQWGRAEAPAPGPGPGANLGLFSITLNDSAPLDRAMLEAYKSFRLEAERAGFTGAGQARRQPSRRRGPVSRRSCGAGTRGRAAGGPALVPQDSLPRSDRDGAARGLRPLAGGRRARWLGRHHPRRLRPCRGVEASWCPGSALRPQDQRCRTPADIRAARVADGDLAAAEAVRAYHGELEKLGVQPHRPLDDDLARSPSAAAYGG